MFRWTRRALVSCALGAVFCTPAFAGDVVKTQYNIGRPATEAEINAWDIDVRPDFKGLPKGSGTVDQGADIWDSTCASCHGSFGESNSVFTPLVGGTTADDSESGHVAGLIAGGQPSRTTLMKVATVSTLWDYIHRAMPWDNPKSLEPDEVYGVLAYLLNLAEIVPADFTLSDENIAQVQEKMPNRHGMKFWDGLWKVDGKPDTNNVACMSDCPAADEPSSLLPPHARDAHGDLAAQMRVVGPVRGVNTHEPALSGTVDENEEGVRAHARSTLAVEQASAAEGQDAGAAGSTDESAQKVMALLKDAGCMACHATDKKVLGPSFADIAAKYKGQDGAVEKLAGKVQKGGAGAWGAVPMPPHPALPDDDAKSMIELILATGQ
ncbi:c-type cytochrome [Pusillimonas sp. SM2304]|uniref:c-type cytochrome n=1 Tax=Pusillimonas sp. SM2304 TaxID=3073241 RepID=UPI0028769402|nr:c-type cytochrome [Pusillimonas sp. SM2304]MDS1142278.1 c-type cytochrome [Pusillimonas sp. SM2304]